MHELKNYRGAMCNDNEKLWKIWRGIDLLFQSWHKRFDECWLKHWKVSKIYTLMGCFWLKYIMFELKKYRGVVFHDAREWCKIWRMRLIQSRKRMSLKFTRVLCVITMKNDTKFEKKLNCHFKTDMRNLTNFDPST